jgi:hypothetical protein
MSKSQEIPWKRITAEGAAILVSILLAFGIDAWWDERQDRVELRGMLLAVLEDFRASKQNVEDAKRVTIAQQDSIIQLLKIAYGQAQSPDEVYIDGLLRDVNWWLGYVPVITTSLNAVANSDHVTMITDVELRNDLADWPLQIERLQNAVTVEIDFLARDFWPFIRQNTNWAQIDAVHDRYPGNPNFEYPDFPLSPPGGTDHSLVLANIEMQNILFYGWEIKAEMIVVLERADARLDTTISLLERELN